MWLDSKAVNCPQKWGNFTGKQRLACAFAPLLSEPHDRIVADRTRIALRGEVNDFTGAKRER